MVKLLPYTPEWKDEFNKEKDFLLNMLGSYNVIIEHVGSTSIEGCPAKPVIDILIGVESLEYRENLISIFLENGYIYKVNVPGEIYFKKSSNGLTTHHIHIAPIRGEVWNNQVLFRDYMRNHQDMLSEYITIKKQLAQAFPEDRDSYSKGKEAFILQVIFDAKNEITRKRERKDS